MAVTATNISMQIIKALNLGVAFLLELVMLAALVFAGLHFSVAAWLKWVITIGAPIIVMILWGLWAAPNSSTRLHQPWLSTFHIAIFALSALALWAAHKPKWAIILIVVESISEALAVIWRQ